jgi:photosystem II stability/assembly factor-like uncharacterized protein
MTMKHTILAIFIFSLAINCYSQWTEQTSGVTSTLYSVSGFDDNTAWVCGAGGKVLRTTNGGTNWNATTSPNAALAFYVILGIDANTALVSGSNATTTWVYKTANGGANWAQVFTQTGGGFIDVIAPIVSTPPKFALIGDPVGGRWSIWVSSNNGDTFDSTGLNIPQAGTETGLNNCYDAYNFSDGFGYLWFGTTNSKIYRIGHGSPHTEATTGLAEVDVVKFVAGVYGFAGGTTTLGSNDSGNTWSANPVPGTGSVVGAVFSFTYSYYCRGTQIYASSNGGSNWALHYSAPTGLYTHMAQGGNYIWAIRNNGGISRLTNPIGIENISTGVPSKFALHQNYPNPFNPVTKIKFDVPVKSNVKIEVTDIIGRTVSVLFNGNLNAGAYETSWDAGNNASGVYFIRLISGNFRDTKKIILLK